MAGQKERAREVERTEANGQEPVTLYRGGHPPMNAPAYKLDAYLADGWTVGPPLDGFGLQRALALFQAAQEAGAGS